MESSHLASDLDPSSVLGFGSGLAMLGSSEEVGRLLTGAVRSMGLADLQAVILTVPPENEPQILGSWATETLSDSVCEELRRLYCNLSVDSDRPGSPAQWYVEVDEEAHPALAATGVQQLSVVRLASIDRDFGVLIAGRTNPESGSSLDASNLRMLAAQASMALHRIHIDQQRENKAQALQESETRYRELYESAPVAYVSAAPDGEIRMVNEQATRLLGASKEALIGRSMPQLCLRTPDGTGTEAAEALARHLKDGGPMHDREVKLCRADGEKVWVSLTMQSLDHPDAGAERLAMMIDITDRKEMETALREARDELEARVQERTAELQQANDRLKRQTKRLEALREVDRAILAAESPREIATVAARRAQDLVPCERVSVAFFDRNDKRVSVLAAQQSGESLLESGTHFSINEYPVTDQLKAGQIQALPNFDEGPSTAITDQLSEAGIRSAIMVPMMASDTLIGTVNLGALEPRAFGEAERRIGQELADHLAVALRQGRLLETVQRQREELEERVQERTAELESFTYSVSHDLRTPLRAIDGYTRILREEHADQLDEEGQRLLDVVHDSAQTMGDLIDDLLTLSRLGRREMNHGRIDMNAVAEEVHEELCRSDPNAGDVTCEIQPLPDALGDRTMIRQVLTNLLSNALKFTRDEESPHIEVGAEDRGDETVYFVRDNGVGFDMEYADKLFGVFQRLHDEEAFEGTGVGLAIVERIVKRHDGTVWGTGTEGEGATLFFTLPKSTSNQ